jgi:hypothetical protein
MGRRGFGLRAARFRPENPALWSEAITCRSNLKIGSQGSFTKKGTSRMSNGFDDSGRPFHRESTISWAATRKVYGAALPRFRKGLRNWNMKREFHPLGR